jgi:hypothetical protein
MPSLHVPMNYNILERSSGGWIPMSQCISSVGGVLYAWNGIDNYVAITITRVLPSFGGQNVKMKDVLLLDSVTLLCGGKDIESVNACYIWSLPKPESGFLNGRQHIISCTCKDHRLSAIKDFAKTKDDKKSKRKMYVIKRKRFENMLSMLTNDAYDNFDDIPYHPIGKSLIGVYNDDFPVPQRSFNKLCEKFTDTNSRIHLKHYVETCLLLKGQRVKKCKTKNEHIEISDDSIPLKVWRKLRRAVCLCGIGNTYSMKVRQTSHKNRTKRLVRLRLQPPSMSSTCQHPAMIHEYTVKENVFVDTVKATESEIKLDTNSWVELSWDSIDTPIVIEGIQIWANRQNNMSTCIE